MSTSRVPSKRSEKPEGVGLSVGTLAGMVASLGARKAGEKKGKRGKKGNTSRMHRSKIH